MNFVHFLFPILGQSIYMLNLHNVKQIRMLIEPAYSKSKTLIKLNCKFFMSFFEHTWDVLFSCMDWCLGTHAFMLLWLPDQLAMVGMNLLIKKYMNMLAQECLCPIDISRERNKRDYVTAARSLDCLIMEFGPLPCNTKIHFQTH